MRTLFCSFLLATALACAQNPYHIVARYPVPGDGGWDYVTLDPATRNLYLSHGTQVDVINADTGKSVGVIPDTPGVHGIAIAPAAKRGFTTNGRENKVSVFDPATLKVSAKIDVGKGPDSIFYDAVSNRVFTGNHGSHDITAIDAATAAVVGTVAVGGDAEAAATGRDGLIYVNLEDKNEVAVFDPKTLAVKRRHPIGIAGAATGLAYDPKTNRLFLGCREKPLLVVMDAASGKVVASAPIGNGVDWVSFDPDSKLVFASCGDGTLRVFRQKSADEYEDLGPLKTQAGARTMAFDPKTKRVFLPTAEVVVTPAADPTQRPQRKVTPGSFVVLVAGR